MTTTFTPSMLLVVEALRVRRYGWPLLAVTLNHRPPSPTMSSTLAPLTTSSMPFRLLGVGDLRAHHYGLPPLAVSSSPRLPLPMVSSMLAPRTTDSMLSMPLAVEVPPASPCGPSLRRQASMPHLLSLMA